MSPAELRTERLRLRPIGHDDLDVVTRIQADPELMAHIHAGVARTPEQCAAELGRSLRHWELHGCGGFVVYRHDGALVGTAGFNTPEWLPEVMPARDIGWTVLQEHQRNGYATEAAGALIGWFFGHGLGDRLLGIHNHDNPRSGAVMRRVGMNWWRAAVHPELGYPIDLWEMMRAD